MEPRIGHWHCRYRLVGGAQEAGAAAERLERAVRPRVAEAYGAALARLFEGDPAVYVLRRVHVRLALGGVAAATETALAREWGRRLGAAVVRGVVAAGEDGGNLARFDDQTDYAAHFISDLLDDLAWDRWYYDAFSELRGVGKAEAILALLVEHRDSLGTLFGRLRALGCLERVLALLGRAGAEKLWTAVAPPAAAPPDAQSFRVFVRAAMRLIDLLELWAAPAPGETQLLEEYAAEGPASPDWRDRRSLAAAVLSVVRHAARRERVARFNPEAGERLARASAQIQSEFDWLDAEWLAAALPSALARATDGGASSSPPEPLPARAAVVTPLQRRLLELVRTLLLSGEVKLERGPANSAANAMRLYAALPAADAELAACHATPSLVDNLLLCAEWCARAPEPAETLAAVRAGRDASSSSDCRPGQALRAVLAAGPAAADALEEIVRQTGGGHDAGAAETVLQTECAGLFLAIRAALDMRLPQLASAAGAGPLSSVLLALGIQWAGRGATRGGEIDAGLAFWCGLGVRPREGVAQVLSALDDAGCRRLLAEARELVEARRALHPAMASADDALPGETFANLTAGWPPDVPVRRELVLVAAYALRLWAQWLPGVAGSSVPYLLRQLLRRGGELRVRGRGVAVLLRPAPLDVVLEMASYTKELSCVPWLGDRKVTFRIERSRA